MNVLMTTELYALSSLSLWNVNYISVLKDTIKKRQDSDWEICNTYNQRRETTATREDLCLKYVKNESVSKRHTTLKQNGQKME